LLLPSAMLNQLNSSYKVVTQIITVWWLDFGKSQASISVGRPATLAEIYRSSFFTVSPANARTIP